MMYSLEVAVYTKTLRCPVDDVGLQNGISVLMDAEV
jgi:hypothetical protein